MDRLRHVRLAARRHWPVAISAGVIATIGFSLPGAAQNLADVQRELTEMRRHYDAELKRLQRDYDARIRRLEAQLKAAEKKPITTARGEPAKVSPEMSGAAITPPPAPGPEVAVSEMPPAPASFGFTIGTPPREPWPIGPATPPPANASASAGSFNPAIGVILQGKASAFSQNPDTYRVLGFPLGDEGRVPGKRGLSLDESELNFQANVDPYLFGNLTLSIDPENHLSIEEAFLQTTSLPWALTLRAGRFFSGIAISTSSIRIPGTLPTRRCPIGSSSTTNTTMMACSFAGWRRRGNSSSSAANYSAATPSRPAARRMLGSARIACSLIPVAISTSAIATAPACRGCAP